MSEPSPYTPPETDPKPAPGPKEKLPGKVHAMCGWPLVLVFLGGLVGGALGGAAYGINLAIYRSSLPIAAKIGLNILVGLAAIAGWLAIVVALNS